jgi:hypothetical protein
VHLADRSPDLLNGAFTSYVPKTDGIAVTDGTLLCTGEKEKISFILKKVPVTGDNLTVRIRAKGEPMQGYPKEVARLMEVELLNNGEALVGRKLPVCGIGIHGQGEQEGIPAGTGAQMSYKIYNAKNGARPAYFMHPPGKDGKGYTWFRRDVTVPADGKLEFYTAMGPKSPALSDGVWFRVQVAEISGEKTGTFKQIFEHTQIADEWIQHSVSLAQYAGKSIVLKFISDCGPNDHSTTDHSYWGSIQLAGNEDYGIGDEGVEQSLYMSYLNGNPFVSRFFFPQVNRKFADIRITVEGPEPVVFESITVHAAPDTAYREFEKGLVLANPGLDPFTFDLEKLLPGKEYRRFKATPMQDTVANNGQPVGQTVTLGAKDGLFLVREP